MILKLLDRVTRKTQSFNIRSNEDFTPIIMLYPEVRSIVFYGYEHSNLSEDYSPRLRKIVDQVAEYLKQYNLEVSIESENIWEMHDPLNPFEKADKPTKKYYHITDNPHFALNSNITPEDNSISLNDRSGRKGIYLAQSVDTWVNGHGYARPYVAEFEADPSFMDSKDVGGRWGGERFVPNHHFDKIKLNRVIPIDAHAREQYGGHGWIERERGKEFDTQEPISNSMLTPRKSFEGYKYTGKDVREMSPEEHTSLENHFKEGYKKLYNIQDEPEDELGKGQMGDWTKEEGYRIAGPFDLRDSYKVPFDIKKHPFGFEVYHKDSPYPVASLDVAHDHKMGVMLSADTRVDKDHQRKGIATSLYQHAETLTGKKFAPAIQTPEGEALWAQKDRPFGKTETYLTAASLLLSLTTTFIPANLAKADIKSNIVNVYKYRPYGHKPEDKFLQTIMELESTSGMNTNHPEPSCIGRWGLMTPTIKDMVRLFDSHNPDMQFANLETAQLKQLFKKRPELELHIARILARYVIAKQKGDLVRAAYTWKYGQNIPTTSITDEKLMNEPYIQKFKEVSGRMVKNKIDDFATKLKTWVGKRKEKESNPELWSPSIPDYSAPREPDPAYIRDTSKLRANIARANR